MAPSNELKQILDEVEETPKVLNECRDVKEILRLAEIVIVQHGALVKALRRAEAGLFKFTSEWADKRINMTASETLQEMTAILNQGRAKKEKEVGE